MWTEQRIKTALTFIYHDLLNDRYELKPDHRIFGYAEGLLKCAEKIPTGKYQYRDIKYENWLGKIKTRKETYYEYICRLTGEFIAV